MKSLFFLTFFALSQQSNLDENKDYTLNDHVDDEEPLSDGHRLIPDINCLVNDFPQFFGFPDRDVNPNIESQELN